MSKQYLSREIRELISNNQTQEAIKRLSIAQFSKVDKELVILTSQYNRIQQDLLMNTISRDEAERKINKINQALLTLSDQVDRDDDNDLTTLLTNQTQGKTLLQRWWSLLLIPVLALGIFFVMSNNGNEESTKEKDETQVTAEPVVGKNDDIAQQRIQDSIKAHQAELDRQAQKRRQDSISADNVRQARIIENQKRQDSITAAAAEKTRLLAEKKRLDSIRVNRPIKVKFTLHRMDVIKDGDGPFDGAGDFTWEFRVNGKVIEKTTREFDMDDGERRTFNVEKILEMPLKTARLNFDAVITENDSGGTGDDDIINISTGYSREKLLGLAKGQKRNESNLGTHSDGDPQVRIHWSVLRLE